MVKETKVKKEEPTYATKEDLNSVLEAITALKDMVVKKDATPEQKVAEAVEKEDKITSSPDVNTVPPSWRKIVDEVLGQEFGLNVSYPEKGSGFLFKLIVPKEKSNASQSHWDYYKSDIRTRAIGFGEGIEGVRKYCEIVLKNLTKK